jgi:t-SNARE complex subunit (syntaxin)
MGGGIGFTRAGMDGMKSNRALLKDSLNRNFTQKGGTKGIKIKIEKADPEVLKAIKAKAQANRKRNTVILLIGIVLIIVCLVLLFGSLF